VNVGEQVSCDLVVFRCVSCVFFEFFVLFFVLFCFLFRQLNKYLIGPGLKVCVVRDFGVSVQCRVCVVTNW